MAVGWPLHDYLLTTVVRAPEKHFYHVSDEAYVKVTGRVFLNRNEQIITTLAIQRFSFCLTALTNKDGQKLLILSS